MKVFSFQRLLIYIQIIIPFGKYEGVLISGVVNTLIIIPFGRDESMKVSSFQRLLIYIQIIMPFGRDESMEGVLISGVVNIHTNNNTIWKR